MKTAAQIPGGYILLARKLLKNGVMKKPPLYIKLWLWMLLQASFKEHGNLKRGQFFTTIDAMRDAMAYKTGYRISRPTSKQIRVAYDFLTKGKMIDTTKVTHGMLITISNYGYYQNFGNYEGHSEGHDESQSEGTILRKKGNKECNNVDDISILLLRYSEESKQLIKQCFEAISRTRKTGRVSESVLFAQLQKWKKYAAEQVTAGIKTYLSKQCHLDGKNEKYLLGIIRNSTPEIKHTPELKSTGSKMLDDYYQGKRPQQVIQ